MKTLKNNICEALVKGNTKEIKDIPLIKKYHKDDKCLMLFARLYDAALELSVVKILDVSESKIHFSHLINLSGIWTVNGKNVLKLDDTDMSANYVYTNYGRTYNIMITATKSEQILSDIETLSQCTPMQLVGLDNKDKNTICKVSSFSNNKNYTSLQYKQLHKLLK